MRAQSPPFPTWISVLGALLLAIVLGLTACWSSRLLDCGPCVSCACGVSVGIVSLVISSLPLLTHYPHLCAEARFPEEEISFLGLQVYPIVAIGASGSFGGLIVAAVQQRTRPRTPLGRNACMYFLLAASSNVVGVVSALHFSCQRNFALGLPLSAVWVSTSWLSNLILQKIVVMRAALIDDSMLPSCLSRLLVIEAILASALGVVATVGAVSKAQASDVFIVFAGSSIAVFILCDLIFSVLSCMVMRKAVQEICRRPQTALELQDSSGEFFSADGLARAIFLTKLNLVLVALSVSTTSFFYLALVGNIVASSGQSENNLTPRSVALSYISWLLDSMFNDVCVVFIGFGPTASALRTVGTAANPDVPGEAVPPASGAVPAADTLGVTMDRLTL